MTCSGGGLQGAPRDVVCMQQLVDDGGLWLAGCMPQPPDSVPPHMVSHVGLASAGQQLSRIIIRSDY